MILRNQISAAAEIPQKRSSAFFHQAIAIHRLYRDSVSVVIENCCTSRPLSDPYAPDVL